jgi:tRNA pseudouridine13 synthase
MSTFDPARLPPLVTAALPGIGGRIKEHPEDFEVEEIPAYPPCGSGDFLYLWVEKRGLGAEYFVRQIARRLDINPNDLGTAGLKDRHAVTRQMVSVPGSVEPKLPRLDGDGIRVLQVSRHTNKLKPGHLHGNRFRILVRGVDAAAVERLAPLVEQVRREGMVNYYGPQRFGRDGETVRLGLGVLTGQARPPRSGFLKRLALSAAQSALFNHYLATRLQDRLMRTVLLGDVMSKRPFGGMFTVEDVAREQQRFEAGETVPAGPIFGRKTFPAAGPAAEREAAVLQEAGLTKAQFSGFGKLLQGTRRWNLVFTDDLTAAVEPEGVRLAFTLPAGSYATVLLREFMKTEVADPDEGTRSEAEEVE